MPQLKTPKPAKVDINQIIDRELASRLADAADAEVFWCKDVLKYKDLRAKHKLPLFVSKATVECAQEMCYQRTRDMERRVREKVLKKLEVAAIVKAMAAKKKATKKKVAVSKPSLVVKKAAKKKIAKKAAKKVAMKKAVKRWK